MADVWSFNTTVRNPERMQNMLRALSEMEGDDFDLAGQEKFFGLQIKKRLYKPSKRKLQDVKLIKQVYSEESADDLGDEIVQLIVDKYKDDPVDGSGRGRTTAGILNRFGLCIAQQAKGAVVITEAGKKWLAGDIDDEELFTKFFLKWQYPNFIENGYDGFDIKPFVGTIKLIQKVNESWEKAGNKPVGLSKDEYKLFVPSLKNELDIGSYVKEIIEYRNQCHSKHGKERTDYMAEFMRKRIKAIFGDTKSVATALSDLRDYTDSSIRYFRVSGLMVLRGENTHFDISQDKTTEINRILSDINIGADNFGNYEDYFRFLSDINSLQLPWQNEHDLNNIKVQLTETLKDEATENKVDLASYSLPAEDISLKKQVEDLQAILNEVRLQSLRVAKHDVGTLEKCIHALSMLTSRNYQPVSARPSLDFEWYATQALMVINDAVSIEPSFKMGDDGIPTGFRANVADVECTYLSFGMTLEVTLLLGRDQWLSEGQPVMRHLRDFEDKNSLDENYCLFVAPLLHRDTINTFWFSNKSEYEGRSQKIIPLTLMQFINFLQKSKQKLIKSQLDHETLRALFDSLIMPVDKLNNSSDWLIHISEVIERWG